MDLVSLGCRTSGELREVGGSSPVNLRHRVGVVPQSGCSAAAVAEARRGIAQVEACREQLAMALAAVWQHRRQVPVVFR
jgi:hypothetical protein